MTSVKAENGNEAVFWSAVFRSGVGHAPTLSALGYTPDPNLPSYLSSLETTEDFSRVLIYRMAEEPPNISLYYAHAPLYRVNLGHLSAEQGVKLGAALVQRMLLEDRRAARAQAYKCFSCGAVDGGYMLLDGLWEKVAGENRGGILCFSCCEHRLGRRITPSDLKPGVALNIVLCRMYSNGFMHGQSAQ